ncbi:hypothetical protein SO802_023449 [Lithocarpus litseifolius]|uniref:DC1 domain-containing protein n=1 Tax=Lithocarpus litseifolius TaxID=425828 RepID=A0AAW2C7M6_9ROSI
MFDKGFVYRCNANNCNFQLDRECAFMRPVKVKEEDEEGQEKLIRTHPYHDHPLLLLEKVPDEHFKCIICLKYCSDAHSTYGCFPCRLFLHEGSCFETKFPPQLQHFYHSHLLTLSLTQSDRDIQCKACYSWGRNIWYYSCKQCDNFVMDIACALLPTTIKCESQIQHFLHGHPLTLGKANNKKLTQHCYVCVKPCTGPIYVCDFCKDIYFHISCLEFPQQICHPFHPYHPVTLVDLRGYKHCNACRKTTVRARFTYICQGHGCRFNLHTECSTMMMPSITYQGHSHLLQFRDDNIENSKLKCIACKSNISESYVFTCLYCDLNLHLHCGPLPYTFKIKHHIHPLVLTNSPVQDEVVDETDEFYCHACEEERDPQLPVYYCAECEFVTEIKCVFSEIISSLKGENGDVELRSTLGHSGKLICKNKAKEMVQKKEQIKTTLTLYDILKSWSKDEIEQLNSVLSVAEIEKFIAKEDEDDEDGEFEVFLLYDKNYTQFMKVFYRGAKIPAPFENVEKEPKVNLEWASVEEVASVGDYMIIQRLAPILEHLLSKHGDIKFNIQFAFDHLKRVVQAYLGLRLRKEVDDALDKIDRDILELKEKRKRVIAAKTKESSLKEECLKEASILKHWTAAPTVADEAPAVADEAPLRSSRRETTVENPAVRRPSLGLRIADRPSAFGSPTVPRPSDRRPSLRLPFFDRPFSFPDGLFAFRSRRWSLRLPRLPTGPSPSPISDRPFDFAFAFAVDLLTRRRYRTEAREAGERLKGCDDAEKVVVAVKASKVIPRTALVWALTHVFQPGDCITLFVVVPSQELQALITPSSPSPISDLRLRLGDGGLELQASIFDLRSEIKARRWR